MFAEEGQVVVAEVVLTEESLAAIRQGGAPAAREIAQRLARRLEPELLRAAQPPPQPRRRTRAQLLADRNRQFAKLKARTQAKRQASRRGEGLT